MLKRTLKSARIHVGKGSVAAAAWIRAHMTRQRALRLGWYASLVALLVLLGSASWSYRNRASKGEYSPVPPEQAVMAQATPAPLLPEPTPLPVTYYWPVEGEIIGDYTPEGLVWCQTLGQWQAHEGIDIAAQAGEAVVAWSDGTVVDAYRDRLWGNTIVIEHADGMRSTYCGLNTLQLVQTGEPVEGGAVISSVGDTAACESEMPWHLHFSLERGEKSVDVEKFMEAHGCGLKKQGNNV